MSDLIQKAKDFAVLAHWGQTWAEGKPYVLHLDSVAEVLGIYGWELPFISNNQFTMLWAAAYLHDTVEDTSTTIEDIKREFGPEVAALVWAVTNEPGKNRAERHAATYPKIANTPLALFLKLADRIANVEASVLTDSKLLRMYQKEYPGFKAALQKPGEYVNMWATLDELLELKGEG